MLKSEVVQQIQETSKTLKNIRQNLQMQEDERNQSKEDIFTRKYDDEIFNDKSQQFLKQAQEIQKDIKTESKIEKSVQKETQGKGYKGLAPLGSSNNGIQSLYLEQYINDMLQKSELAGINTVLKRPEHKKPLNRYGLDRVTLQNQGLSNEQILSLYRSLKVHSSGIFELIRAITSQVSLTSNHKSKSLLEDKQKLSDNVAGVTKCDTSKDHRGKVQLIQCNIWKVYQVLLENTCPTDYEMLTRNIVLQSNIEKEDLQDQTELMLNDFRQKEIEIKDKMKSIQEDLERIQQQNIQCEKEKDAMVEKMTKSQAKFEEEVGLRLHFEQKMNTLYLINTQSESKAALILEKYEKLEIAHNQLLTSHKKFYDENLELKIFKDQQLTIMNAQDQKQQLNDQQKDQFVRKINVLQTGFQYQQESSLAMKKRQEDQDHEILQLKLQIQKLNDELQSSQSYGQKLNNFYEKQKQKCDELHQEIKALEQKLVEQQNLVDKEKLIIADIKNDNQRLRLMMASSDKELEVFVNKSEKFEQKYKALNDILQIVEKQRLEEFESRNQVYEEMATLQCVKIDLEFKLSQQIKQTDQLISQTEDLDKIVQNLQIQSITNEEVVINLQDKFYKENEQRESIQAQFQQLLDSMRKQEVIVQQNMITSKQEKDSLHQQNVELNFQLDQMRNNFKKTQIEKSDINSKFQRTQNELILQVKENQSFLRLKEEMQKKMFLLEQSLDSLQQNNQQKQKQNEQAEELFNKKLEMHELQLYNANREYHRKCMELEDQFGFQIQQDQKLQQKDEFIQMLERDLMFLSRQYTAFLFNESYNHMNAKKNTQMIETNRLLIQEQKKILDTLEQNTIKVKEAEKQKEELLKQILEQQIQLSLQLQELKGLRSKTSEQAIQITNLELLISKKSDINQEVQTYKSDFMNFFDLYKNQFTQTNGIKDKSVQIEFWLKNLKKKGDIKPYITGMDIPSGWRQIILQKTEVNGIFHSDEIDLEGKKLKDTLKKRFRLVQLFFKIIGMFIQRMKLNAQRRVDQKYQKMKKGVKEIPNFFQKQNEQIMEKKSQINEKIYESFLSSQQKYNQLNKSTKKSLHNSNSMYENELNDLLLSSPHRKASIAVQNSSFTNLNFIEQLNQIDVESLLNFVGNATQSLFVYLYFQNNSRELAQLQKNKKDVTQIYQESSFIHLLRQINKSEDFRMIGTIDILKENRKIFKIKEKLDFSVHRAVSQQFVDNMKIIDDSPFLNQGNLNVEKQLTLGTYVDGIGQIMFGINDDKVQQIDVSDQINRQKSSLIQNSAALKNLLNGQSSSKIQKNSDKIKSLLLEKKKSKAMQILGSVAKEYQITDPNEVEYLKIKKQKSSVLSFGNNNSQIQNEKEQMNKSGINKMIKNQEYLQNNILSHELKMQKSSNIFRRQKIIYQGSQMFHGKLSQEFISSPLKFGGNMQEFDSENPAQSSFQLLNNNLENQNNDVNQQEELQNQKIYGKTVRNSIDLDNSKHKLFVIQGKNFSKKIQKHLESVGNKFQRISQYGNFGNDVNNPLNLRYEDRHQQILKDQGSETFVNNGSTERNTGKRPDLKGSIKDLEALENERIDSGDKRQKIFSKLAGQSNNGLYKLDNSSGLRSALNMSNDFQKKIVPSWLQIDHNDAMKSAYVYNPQLKDIAQPNPYQTQQRASTAANAQNIQNFKKLRKNTVNTNKNSYGEVSLIIDKSQKAISQQKNSNMQILESNKSFNQSTSNQQNQDLVYSNINTNEVNTLRLKTQNSTPQIEEIKEIQNQAKSFVKNRETSQTVSQSKEKISFKDEFSLGMEPFKRPSLDQKKSQDQESKDDSQNSNLNPLYDKKTKVVPQLLQIQPLSQNLASQDGPQNTIHQISETVQIEAKRFNHQRISLKLDVIKKTQLQMDGQIDILNQNRNSVYGNQKAGDPYQVQGLGIQQHIQRFASTSYGNRKDFKSQSLTKQTDQSMNEKKKIENQKISKNNILKQKISKQQYKEQKSLSVIPIQQFDLSNLQSINNSSNLQSQHYIRKIKKSSLNSIKVAIPNNKSSDSERMINKQEKVSIAGGKRSMDVSPREQSLRTPSSVSQDGDQHNNDVLDAIITKNDDLLQSKVYFKKSQQHKTDQIGIKSFIKSAFQNQK